MKRMATATHEMACGSDALQNACDIATDVNNLVSRYDAGSNTANIATKDSAVGSAPVVVSHIGVQGGTKTQDAGSDCFKTQTSDAGA